VSHFFIERPIFAWVVAILIMLAGTLAVVGLPISQYPNVAPTAIAINGFYPGASADTIRDSVVQIVEQQMTGLDGYRYMDSSSASNGIFEIILTFEQGTDPDIAQVQVQNKLSLATPLLPAEVQAQGMSVDKQQINFFLIVTLYSEDGSMDESDLGDLIESTLKEPLGRVDGVGYIQVFGGQYGMRVWLKPDKLRSYNMTPQDVLAAVQEQNVQVSAGRLAGDPTVDGAQFTATMIAQSRMTSKEEFENILIRTNPDGSQVRLTDVADVELGREKYGFSARVGAVTEDAETGETIAKAYPGCGLALRLAAGANVLETTKEVKKRVEEMSKFFPPGVKVAYAQENAPVVEESIEKVAHTLIEAIVLVFGVMFLFLQRFRVTLIPTFAVPVVLLGTFGVIYACGMSLNVIIMFALTLAIGLLVDDAIVVVENVERLMSEEGLDAKTATKKTMDQIQGALVGVGAVICAVFIPTSFFGGSTGVIYRQFSVAIISAMTLSVFIALTFTPALCATMLKSHGKKRFDLFGLLFGWFFKAFNFGFNACSAGYGRSVGYIVRRRLRFMVLFALIVVAVARLYPQMPTAFLPDEDQGTLFVQAQLPEGASQERTEEVVAKITDYLLENESDSVNAVFEVTGFSFSGMNPNAAICFVSLKPFDQRQGEGQDVYSIRDRLMGAFAGYTKAQITPIVPPSIMELGTASGLEFFLQDQAAVGHDKFNAIQGQFLGAMMQSGKFAIAFPNALPDEAQYKIDVNSEKVRAMKMNLTDVNNVLSIALGSAYINDFVDRGRVKKVYAQGEPSSRVNPVDLEKWHARNQDGQMVPFSAFASGHWINGAPKLARFNGVESVKFTAIPLPGVSTGDAMKVVEDIVENQLPQGVGLSYSGISFEERQAGSQTGRLYALAMVVVFLCLAALYESWSVPISIAMVVPFGALGAIFATLNSGLSNDVFFQIGLLTVMGLSAKNAILIVEFAKQMVEKENVPLLKAAVIASKLRLRPIIMTSMAFALGVLPMVRAHGASAVSQQSLGTCVLGGTLAATFLAIFFVPLFYVFVVGIFNRKLLYPPKNNKANEQNADAQASA